MMILLEIAGLCTLFLTSLIYNIEKRVFDHVDCFGIFCNTIDIDSSIVTQMFPKILLILLYDGWYIIPQLDCAINSQTHKSISPSVIFTAIPVPLDLPIHMVGKPIKKIYGV